MKRQLLKLLVGLVLIYTGCTMAPEYDRPAASIPAVWPQGEAYKDLPVLSEAAHVNELKRHEFFVDDKLQTIITIALNNNLDLRLATLRVEKTRALYGIKRANLLPTINAVGSGSRQQIPGDLSPTGESMIAEQYSVNLGISSWEIDFFGRMRSLKDQALQTYLSTEQARRSAQNTLVAEVARVYLALAGDLENLKLANLTLDNQLDSYNLVKKRYEFGLTTELDVYRAQTQVESARRDIPRFTQLVAQDKNALNLLAGIPLPDDLLPIDLESIIPPKEISAGLISDVLLNRPDILAAEHSLMGAYAFIGAARAAFFPRISLTTSFGTASDELSGLFQSGTGTWLFAPQIAMPIFDSRTWAALQVSEAEKEIALAEYQRAIQAAFKEVADVLAVQGTINDQISSQQSYVNATMETYRLSQLGYEKGINSYLGVLDAQRSLVLAQKILVVLQQAKLTNQVRLYAVLGGGIE